MSFTVDYLTLDKFSPDPSSPEDGDLWYNEVTDTIKIRAENITRSLVDDVLFTTHTGSINPHNTTASDIGLGNVTNDPQLLRTSNDFSTFSQKTTVSGADVLLIEDSEDSGNKKWILISALPASTGITEPQHQLLDTLVHDISEDFFEEITYTGFKVTNVTDWTDSSKTLKIREQLFTYSGFRVATATTIQYNGAGIEVERLVEEFGYSGFKITTISGTRTP